MGYYNGEKKVTACITQSPFPTRLLVRGGQTSPHSPRLVLSHNTCPPLSPSPHANSFVTVLDPAVINNNPRAQFFCIRYCSNKQPFE